VDLDIKTSMDQGGYSQVGTWIGRFNLVYQSGKGGSKEEELPVWLFIKGAELRRRCLPFAGKIRNEEKKFVVLRGRGS